MHRNLNIMHQNAIVFDLMYTLYNPDTDSLYDGVIEVLEELSKSYELYLVSIGGDERLQQVRDLGIEKYFTGIHPVSTKRSDVFRGVVAGHSDLSKSWSIGDGAGEINSSMSIGMRTIWIDHSGTGDNSLGAEFVAGSFADAIEILTTKLKDF